MIKLVFNGQEQEIYIAFDVRMVGTGAKEIVNIALGNNVVFTAGDHDRVNLLGKLEDYTITSIGNLLYLLHYDGSSVALSVCGSSIVGFSNGAATLDMVFPPGEMPRVLLGNTVVAEEALVHDEVDLITDQQDSVDDSNDAALLIDDIHIDPLSPIAGESFLVDVSFMEIADVETENLSVNLAIEEHFGETIDTSSDQLSEINNESTMVRFDGLEIFEPGVYTVTAFVSADNADTAVMERELTVIPEMPDALAVTIDAIVAGRVGDAVTVAANVAHFGEAGEVSFVLQQEETIISETVSLQRSHPGEETVAFIFEDANVFDPGMVEIILSVEEDGMFAEDAGIFGLYQAQADYEWQWANPGHSPFNMIGHTVVDAGTGDQYTLGTGFLISPRHMMTSAHVLEYGWEGDLSSLNSVDFFIGRNGGTFLENQGGNHYHGEDAYLQKSEWGENWPDTDMAIVSLDKDIEAANSLGYFDWFWNARDAAEDHNLAGQTLYWGGYPSSGVAQGKDDIGNDLFFQWKTKGVFDDYLGGYDGYGSESGGLWLSPDMAGAPGASGSPIFFKDDNEQYLFAGTFAGSKNGLPVAANLDPAAYDWALTIVQADGYFLDMDYLDSPWDSADLGPYKNLADGNNGNGWIRDYSMGSFDRFDIQIQGVPESDWDDYHAAV